MKPRRKKSAVLSSILLLIITGFACLAFLEVMTRIFLYAEPVNFPPIMAPDNDLCFKLRPGLDLNFSTKEYSMHIVTNGFGFRDDKNAYRPGGIAFVGDSFTFGQGVDYDEGFVKLVQDRLGEKGYNHETYDFGVGSYGTLQERKLAERYIGNLKPKVLVLSFYANDPGENLANEDGCALKVDSDGYLITSDGKGLSYNLNKWLWLHVNLYRVASNMIYGLKVNTRIFDSFASAAGATASVEYKQFLSQYDPETENAWNLTYANLDRINALAKENDAVLVVVLIPSKAQLDETKQERLAKIYSLKDPDFQKIDENLDAFTRREGIPFLDMTREFMEKCPTECYFTIDPHWNEKGHSLAADALAAFLIEKKIV
jgi:lysophospholipase L1-like esterase